MGGIRRVLELSQRGHARTDELCSVSETECSNRVIGFSQP